MFQQPAAIAYPEPTPGASASTWEQEVPIGGEDALQNLAPRAIPVMPQGILTVRNVPSLGAAANSVAFVANDKPFRLLGRAPQRRRVTIVSTAAGMINVSDSMAAGGVGLPVPANVPIPISSAGEIWFAPGIAAGVAGFWAEIDQG